MRDSLPKWLWLLVAIMLVRLVSMAWLPFIDTTEPRYAEIARLMLEKNDWITPWFNAEMPFWGKPPLSFWAQALSMKLFGVNEFAARLPAWLVTWAIIGLLWRMVSVVFDRHIAILSVLIFASMTLTFMASGAVMTDMFLTLGVTLSLVSLILVLANEKPSFWSWGWFVGLAIGLLAKGPIALILVGLPVGLWLFWQRRWRWFWQSLPWFKGTVLMLLLTLPWYIMAEIKTPGFLEYFILGEHVYRFVIPDWQGDLYGNAHQEPMGAIWLFWLGATFPWGILLLIGLLVKFFRKPSEQNEARLFALKATVLKFMLLAMLAPMLFFSFAGNVLWTYVLPGLPFAALLMALVLANVDFARQINRSAIYLSVAFMPLLLTAVSLHFVWHPQKLKTEKHMVQQHQQLRDSHSQPLFYLGDVPFSAQFYSKGSARAINWQQLDNKWSTAKKEAIFLVTRKHYADELASRFGDAVEKIAHNSRHNMYLIKPDK